MQPLIPSLLLALGPALSLCQFPSKPSGLTVVKSKVDPAVTISYKEAQICKQPSGVKTYSGFVHLPASVLADIGGSYDINSYFLYFEARKSPSTAPLAVYLAGGPGESSTYTAINGESGPCYVNYDGTDTINNPWSFNEHVNMLYIDQPLTTGFSYDKLINATFNVQSLDVIPLDLKKSPLPPVNASLGYGVYPSQGSKQTANLTVQAAKSLWHFGEHWLSSFPGYQTQSKNISFWGNSYGGYWVPETAVQFTKNLKALPQDHPLYHKDLTLDAIGITNGCIDFETGGIGYPQFAYNNTYGVHFGSKALYEAVMHNLTTTIDLIEKCRASGEVGDPGFTGSNTTVNKLCFEAFAYGELYVISSFPELQKRDPFDTATIGQPCPWWLPVNTYLNTASVQEELGVPLNFTYDSNTVTNDILQSPSSTGDAVRQNGLPLIEYLLANNVKVAFIFGDRDYRCPWTGGEATALAAKWAHQSDFQAAGYEELQGVTKTGTDHGAVVKQYDQFSFSRVFDAGHAVSAYAPETVARIFERTMFGLDAVTGKKKVGIGYHTSGPANSWSWRNTYPTPPETCILPGRFSAKNPWNAIGGAI